MAGKVHCGLKGLFSQNGLNREFMINTHLDSVMSSAENGWQTHSHPTGAVDG